MVRRIPLRSLGVVATAAAVLYGPADPAWAQQRVGVNSAVNPDADGTPPGASTRRLVLGQEVVFNERIQTQALGQTQVLFLDESSMSIGPNSDLTIDQFVYDPNSGSGKLAMTTTKGVLRFVGGKLSKQDNAVSLQTPTATIAVRGGAFLATQNPNGSLEAIFIYGEQLQISTGNGAPALLRRPGWAVTVSGPGAQPSQPYPVPPGRLATVLAQLDGRPGATGGARQVPTEAGVAASGLPQTISNNIQASLAQANNAQPTVSGRPVQVAISNLQQNLQVNTVQGQSAEAQVSSTQTFQQQMQAPPPVTTTTTTTTQTTGSSTQQSSGPQTVTITYAGHFKDTNGNGTSRGFFDQSAQADGTFTNATLTFPAGSPQNGVLTGTVSGIGTVTIPLAPGTNNFGPTGTSSPFGPLTGTSYLAPDNSFFYASATPVAAPGERAIIFGGQPVGSAFLAPTGSNRFFAFNVQQDPALQSPVPFIRNQAGGNIPNPSVSPFYVVAPANGNFAGPNNGQGALATRSLQGSLAVSGTGTTQSSVLVVGVGGFFPSADTGNPAGDNIIRGAYRPNGSTFSRIGSSAAVVPDGNGNGIYGNTTGITGFVLDQNNYNLSLNRTQQSAVEVGPTGQTTYGFAQPVLPTTLPSGVGVSRTSQALAGNFGGIMNTVISGSPTTQYSLTGTTAVNTNANSSNLNATFTGADAFGSGNTAVLAFGTTPGVSSTRINSTFVDNSRFAAVESQFTPSQVNGTNIQLNGDPTQASRIAMISNGVVPNNPLLPNGLCSSCQYLQWGYWTANLGTPDSTGTTVVRNDNADINTWIAGLPTPASDISTLQAQAFTGSYTGNAIGTVVNGGQYLASGTYNQTYNFATQSGTIGLNFDGRTVAGTVSGNGNNFSSNLAGTNLSGLTTGRFFGPSAAEAGGSFAFRSTAGASYLASGVFAGHR